MNKLICFFKWMLYLSLICATTLVISFCYLFAKGRSKSMKMNSSVMPNKITIIADSDTINIYNSNE